MRKIDVAGSFVAAGAAMALVGFGAPAFASSHSAAAHLHPAVISHPRTAPNRCDGDNDTDDLQSVCGGNQCDGDHDSDDVNCTTGATAANRCDRDHDSDDVNCGTTTNASDGDHDSDDVNRGTTTNASDGDHDSDDVNRGTDGDHDADDVNRGTTTNASDGDHDSDDVNCGTTTNASDGDHDADDWNCTDPSTDPAHTAGGHHAHMYWQLRTAASQGWVPLAYQRGLAHWFGQMHSGLLRLI